MKQGQPTGKEKCVPHLCKELKISPTRCSTQSECLTHPALECHFKLFLSQIFPFPTLYFHNYSHPFFLLSHGNLRTSEAPFCLTSFIYTSASLLPFSLLILKIVPLLFHFRALQHPAYYLKPSKVCSGKEGWLNCVDGEKKSDRKFAIITTLCSPDEHLGPPGTESARYCWEN